MRKARIAVLIALVLAAAWAASGRAGLQRPERGEDHQDLRLPNGKKQSDEILRADHQRNLDDAAGLIKLSEELKAELEKGDAFVLSLSAIKKTEEIEKVARRIRSRLKR